MVSTLLMMWCGRQINSEFKQNPLLILAVEKLELGERLSLFNRMNMNHTPYNKQAPPAKHLHDTMTITSSEPITKRARITAALSGSMCLELETSNDAEPSFACKQFDTDTSTNTNLSEAKIDFITVLSVPTKGSEEAEEPTKKIIDTRHLNVDELETLKKQDIFLYYSIPRSLRRSIAAGRNIAGISKVERRSCISFDCHTDLLMEDI